MFDFLRKKPAPVAAVSGAAPETEARATFTSGALAQSDPMVVTLFGGSLDNPTDEVVTIDSALGVPAIGAAVHFLTRTLAALPVKAYQKGEAGRAEVAGSPEARLFGWAANDEMSGFDARRLFWFNVFTAGRGLAFLERDGRGNLINLWPLKPSKTTIETRGRATLYHYQDGARRVTYQAGEVLDICFLPRPDHLAAVSPVYSNAGTIGLAQAVTRYGARFFKNGGIPPFAISGPIRSSGGVARASADVSAAVKKLADEGGNAITLPDGHTLNKLGVDPEAMQMVEVQRFLIEQVARIYGLPPAFLQDLTHGTFSNTEQQDLQLVKHLVAPWCTAFEAHANLKIFGRKGGGVYLEHVLDGLMRGDLKTRAEATALRINTGQLTLDEARALENRGPVPGGKTAFVQGAMIPAEQAGQAFNPGQPGDS